MYGASRVLRIDGRFWIMKPQLVEGLAEKTKMWILYFQRRPGCFQGSPALWDAQATEQK